MKNVSPLLDSRDKLFLTTHLSKKYCSSYPPVTERQDLESGALIGYDFSNKSYAIREYVEYKDVEMDI